MAENKIPNIENAPENISTQANLLAVGDAGFASACRFAVVITLPKIFRFDTGSGIKIPELNSEWFQTARDLTFLCEAAGFVGRGFETVDVRYYGPSFKLPINTNYNDIGLTILCRGEMQEKKFFDHWHNLINPNSTYDFSYPDDYSTNIDIFAFDEAGHGVYQQTLERAYPVEVRDIETTWASDEINKINVTMTFRRARAEDRKDTGPHISSIVSDSTNVIRNGGSFLFRSSGKI